MADERLTRVLSRLQNLPSISLPTDYPRPAGSNKVIEAAHLAQLPEQTSLSLLKLVLYNENEDEDEDEEDLTVKRPSAFHLLLAAFTVLLHRYTGDTDIVIGSSSAAARDPLVLRISVDPADPYWAIVRRVQQVEREAEGDALPFDVITRELAHEGPLFRVRFFDETDEPEGNFIHSTSLTSDITIFVTRPPATTRASLAPHISLRILYNSLLFTPTRISSIIDQLSVLLRKVASNPLAPVGSVPLLTPAQKAKLPDPTGDLNWCGWKGAITDVFSRNARFHPDRPCVVQSLPTDPQETKTYSYRMILHASNILAHQLIAGGVQREEVVMVYAHRSVDLVVAVMAVLKAGATFSVIDPAYPASRQIIYLRVAQPRGLVVLKGAGSISPSVREFLNTELKIRVEVPALGILPSGELSGSPSPDGVDMLPAVDALRNGDLGLAATPTSAPSSRLLNVPGTQELKKGAPAPLEYGQDYEALFQKLQLSHPSIPTEFNDHPITVFLTGATGFLGAFVLKDLLSREERVKKVICLVRDLSIEKGLARLKEGSTDRAVWDDAWDGWTRIANEADAVLYNGALVHWVYPYEKLRAANVISTIAVINLASARKHKSLVFVSSTSVIDTEHYVYLTENVAHNQSDYHGVPESDDPEALAAEVCGDILFALDMLLETPKLLSLTRTTSSGIWSRAASNSDWFPISITPSTWSLSTILLSAHFWQRSHLFQRLLLDDLPTSTNTTDLDDSNTAALLKQYTGETKTTVDDPLMGLYLAWLVAAGFLPAPSLPSPQKALPQLVNTGSIKAAGRSGV
ncbi:hypothetical protein BDQ12DRAFT_663680 [Crucibulum laeve]|uniref:Male sterility protein-domain-containing protein n=1 Tax=Crucibulum laeve TaxID=68775 RepID=A0A5C3MAY7_9AGAR|nr:hypothetical protein BDQ12DRAFT_663680 [Crucibulum laeve]